MVGDERDRDRIYRKFQEVLGEEVATPVMERLPAGGTAELATKGDVQLLKGDLQKIRDELKVEIRVLEHKVDAVEQRLRAEMQTMGRSITVTLLTVMALFNGMLFAALKLT